MYSHFAKHFALFVVLACTVVHGVPYEFDSEYRQAAGHDPFSTTPDSASVDGKVAASNKLIANPIRNALHPVLANGLKNDNNKNPAVVNNNLHRTLSSAVVRNNIRTATAQQKAMEIERLRQAECPVVLTELQSLYDSFAQFMSINCGGMAIQQQSGRGIAGQASSMPSSAASPATSQLCQSTYRIAMALFDQYNGFLSEQCEDVIQR